MQIYSIVRCAQGSWRWQTPYQIKRYEARMGKNGNYYLRPVEKVSRKLALDRAQSLALSISGNNPVFMGGLNNVQPWQLKMINSINFAS